MVGWQQLQRESVASTLSGETLNLVTILPSCLLYIPASRELRFACTVYTHGNCLTASAFVRGTIFQLHSDLKSGRASSATAAICVSHMFWFFFVWLAGPPAWRSVVCVCLTLAGGTQPHHLYIQFLYCSSGWVGAGLHSGMLCRWWQRQSSVYLIKFSAFSDVR